MEMETKLGTNINFVKMVDMNTVYDPIFHSPQFHILPITRLNLVKRAKFQKCFFWCFFIRNNLSRVDLIIKVVLEFLSDP